jgi:hypothetical protein
VRFSILTLPQLEKRSIGNGQQSTRHKEEGIEQGEGDVLISACSAWTETAED